MSLPGSSTTDANTFDDKGGSQYSQPSHNLVVDAEKTSTGAPDTASTSVPDRAKTADATAATAASAPIVDRGFRAWGTAAGCFLAFFATLGYVTGYGPYQDYYESIFPERSPDDISWIGSIMLCFAYLFAIPAAILNDKLGPQVVLAIGSFFIVFGVMMSSLAREYYQVLLSHGVCVGIGLGICFLPVISLPNQHFARYRGVVVSLAVGGSSIGGVLWAIIFNQMINYDQVSYGWTQRTIGFIQLFCLVLAVLLVRSNVPRNRGVRLGMFPFVQALRNLQLSAFLVATLLSFGSILVRLGF